MKLPAMIYSDGATKKTTRIFGGLNRRNDAAEGELISCENLGVSAYPALCPRKGRGEVGAYTNPTDIFEWNGHMVVIDGSNALYDGEIIGNVTPGQKQFAVVNTKLVIWPDKVYIDLNNNSFKHMDESVTAPGADVSVYTESSITLGDSRSTALGTEEFVAAFYVTPMPQYDKYICELYETLEWTDGAWEGTGEEGELRGGSDSAGSWVGKYVKLKKNTVSGVYNLNSRWEYWIDYRDGNGYQLDGSRDYSEDMEEVCAKITKVTQTMESPGAGEHIYVYTVEFDIIRGELDEPLSGKFEAGDWVSFEGLPGTTPGQEVRISAIDDDTRTLSFPKGSFTILGSYYCRLTEAEESEWNLLTGAVNVNGYGVYYGVTLPPLPAGSVLYTDRELDNMSIITAWNAETGEITGKESDVIPGSSYKQLTFTQGTGIINWPLTVKRKAPEMDYICSHNNRLYGVSNSVAGLTDGTETGYKSRVIYVSELGEPTRFTTFEGVDTDSYQVAEATNGDFTGCCPYGDYVLFFKEHKVLKFYGSYPSAMGYTYDNIEGVKKGCHRSLVIVNEVLYYMGRAGFCAYSGTVPTIVSYKLDEKYSNVLCATDGDKILVCGESGGKAEMLSYTPELGLWLKEDETQAPGMAMVNGTIHMIIGRKLYADGTGDDSGVEWSAELHPFTEDTFKRKKWKYIRVRAEFEAGVTLKVNVKTGDEEYKTWLTAEKTGWQTLTVPMPLMRTDRVSVKLSGKGKCTVREIEREYQLGSDA